MEVYNTATFLLRAVVGITMVMHGYNHVYGGGKLEGTARWFASIGLQPAKVHAMISGYGELVAGALLIVGFLSPFAAAMVIGVMTTAFVTVHRNNGFFTMKDGYEHVLIMAVVCAVIGLIGPGEISIDHAIGWDDELDEWIGLLLTAGLGVAGAAALLVTCWRPPKKDEAAA